MFRRHWSRQILSRRRYAPNKRYALNNECAPDNPILRYVYVADRGFYARAPLKYDCHVVRGYVMEQLSGEHREYLTTVS